MKAEVDAKSSYHPEPPLSALRVFGVLTGPSSVTVNGSPAQSFSFNSSTKVMCCYPVLAKGKYLVFVFAFCLFVCLFVCLFRARVAQW